MTENPLPPPLIQSEKSETYFNGLKEEKPAKGYRPTQQLRSATSERKLLESAEKLFAEHGYLGTKVADIIKHSGCSTGSFYHRFSDKEGLARVLVERYYETTKVAIEALDISKPAHGSLRGLLTGIAEFSYLTSTSRLGVHRAAQRLAQTSPEVLHNPNTLTHLASERVITVLDEYADEIQACDPAAAMQKSVQLIVMIILQTKMGSGNLFPTEREELVELVVNASLGILKLESEK